MPRVMTSNQARSAWNELVEIERVHQVLAGRQPATFAERFWSIDNGTALGWLEQVFCGLPTGAGENARSSDEDIRSAYERRFGRLLDSHLVVRRWAKAFRDFKRTGDTWDQVWATFRLPDLGTADTGDVLRRFRGESFSAQAVQTLVHGDLHLENIIVPEGDQENPVLIDFAHSGWDSIFLDFVVAEMSARWQLCRPLAEEAVEKNSHEAFINDAMRLEAFCASNAIGHRSSVQFVDARFNRIADVIVAIRHNAAKRAQGEPPSSYFLGLAFASLSKLSRIQKDDTPELLCMWAAACAVIQFRLFVTRGSELTLRGGTRAPRIATDATPRLK